MVHGLLELSLLTLLSVSNSPYPAPGTFYTIPSLRWELEPFSSPLFVGGEVSSRCEPAKLNKFNPVTALWDVHVGVRLGPVEGVLGHVSEHGVDQVQRATESGDYLKLTYQVKF